VIVQATAEDLAAVVRLEDELFGPDAWSENLAAAELANPRRLVLVASNDVGATVGYAVTSVVGEVADLFRIGVSPAQQRQGIASDLLDECVRSAIADGASRMLLEVSAANVPAIEFYRAHQFITIDRRTAYYRDGSDALVMERQW
jgi:[ribosomal protein S18]-alanine N-acetyltransferase